MAVHQISIVISAPEVSKEKCECEHETEHADSPSLSSEDFVDAIFPNSVTACRNRNAVYQSEEREHQNAFFFSLRHKGTCEDANRTREAGNRDEVEGVVANILNAFRGGAVGFIDWLGVRCMIDHVATPARTRA